MEVIKNGNGKTVCYVSSESRMIEIVQKGFITIIQFLEDGTMSVENKSIK